ncbi:MAG: hypothetical protein KDC52_11965 [Ignavibacteriae bacterium]|nr:hypothetical protein [Ignavibacteriota bacterium]MCB1584331.1 hypothetical protein [Xanthomonadales bacterium]
MKVILFRFEKETINFLECDINHGNLVLGKKEKISLDSCESRGEKYNKILDELLQIKTRYSPDVLAYQSPQKYRGTIKDEEGFANASMLNLFCYRNSIDILELTPKSTREYLSIPQKEFKSLVTQTMLQIVNDYQIAKSDKLADGLVFLKLIKNHI